MVQSPRFLRYRFDRDCLPENIEIFGDGEIGGKARGLIFSQLAFGICMDKDIPDISGFPYLNNVRFPRSYVLTTDYFDDFMKNRNLDSAVYAKCQKEIEVQEMNTMFLNSEIPSRMKAAIIRILEKETGPIIIRSSSLLEDNTEHSFAGIYLSIFITNQGTMNERIAAFSKAVKRVYASTYNANAKAYRKKHKIPWQREKMALLVQNVIGKTHSDGLFYPLFAGVAFSDCYYNWTSKIDPDDGIARLVVGLGTMAVGRGYARVVSPGAPMLRPEGMDVRAIVKYSQNTFDVLDMASGKFVNRHLVPTIKNSNLYKVMSVIKEHNLLMEAPPLLADDDRIVPTFDPILKNNRHIPFIPILKNLLNALEDLFGIPVDIEFATDFETSEMGEEIGRFYLVQVRPLGARPEHSRVDIPKVEKDEVILASHQVLGNAILNDIHHIVYVSSDVYNFQRAFMVAREIGEVNAMLEGTHYLLIGPGRWGTSNPQLGVPIHYFEISNASVIVEISSEKFTPEVSYGSHFFGDLISANIIYIPIFQEKGDILNFDYLDGSPKALDMRYVKLIEVPQGLKVYADGVSSRSLVTLAQHKAAIKAEREEEHQDYS